MFICGWSGQQGPPKQTERQNIKWLDEGNARRTAALPPSGSSSRARTHSPHAHAMPAACLPLVRQDNPFGALPSGVSNRGHFLFLTDAVIHTSSMHTMHTPDRAKPTGFPSNDRIFVAVSSPCCACGMVGYLVKCSTRDSSDTIVLEVRVLETAVQVIRRAMRE